MKTTRHPMMFLEAEGGVGGGGTSLLDGGAGGQGGAQPFAWTRDEAGTFSDGFLDKLSPDLTEAKPTLAKYKTLPEVFKALHNANQLIGRKSGTVTVPGENATDEEKAAYRKHIGIPDRPEDYKLIPGQVPEGVTWTPERAKEYAALAHEMGVPPAAMEKIAARIIADETASVQTQNQAVEQQQAEAMGVLKKEFGMQFDQKMALATRAAQTVGLPIDSPALSDPNTVIALTKFADMISEDKLIKGDVQATLHPGKTEAQRIMTDPSHPMYQKYTDGDPETAAHVRRLIENG